jgi:hypothetical protein
MTSPCTLIRFDEEKARDAYAAYIAVLTQQRLDPSLVDSPAWTMLRQAAFANFYCAFALEDA